MSTPQPAPNPDPAKVEVNRPLVGVIAAACLVMAGVLWRMPDSNEMWVAGLMRAGLMTGAFWLALPTKDRPAAWANVSPRTLIGVVGGIIAVAARPKLVLMYSPVLIVLGVIGFLLKRRSVKRPDRDSWK
ncbi:MAG: hypothetical protein O2983_00500 [Planctomycetota bacterium]|nr:hypothetical protein [Planctomycetota bacterium]MDA0917724.1 hypothetical protein [Planctomycetota bacterium]MDA1158060.1 hypothetical protein [Planctomycetota bacterium]